MQWKHVDFMRGVIQVRQRFYRGDLEVVKSERSQRDVPMGLLATDLATLYPGPEHAEEYVFSVRTHVGREKKGRVCRDDRAINQHFLRPAAVALGVYYKGFMPSGGKPLPSWRNMPVRTRRKGWPVTRTPISVFTTHRRTWMSRRTRSSNFKIACGMPRLSHNKTPRKIRLALSY